MGIHAHYGNYTTVNNLMRFVLFPGYVRGVYELDGEEYTESYFPSWEKSCPFEALDMDSIKMKPGKITALFYAPWNLFFPDATRVYQPT